MKKISAILLALIMMLSMVASAASITITTTIPEGSATSNTYNAYKIFDAVIDGTVTQATSNVNVAYTISGDSPFFSTVEKYFTLTATANDADVYVAVPKADYTDGDDAKALAADLQAVINAAADTADTTDDIAPTKSVTTTTATATISDLTDGYYLVISSVGSALILDTIGNVEIESKNEYPSLDKKVEGEDDFETANIGDTLTFTIDVKLPATASGEIIVHDTMVGLEYKALTGATIPDGDDEGTDPDAVTGVTDKAAELGDTCSVHFVLSADCVKENAGKTVTITYTATLTADVANNEAYLQDGDYTTKPDHNDVYNTDIVIDKIAADDTADSNEDNAKLEGAEFVLYKLDENSNKLYYKATYTETTTGEGDAAVTTKTLTQVEWVSDIANATVMTTDANGVAGFDGLANGTYYLLETKAPTGYNLLTAPVKVDIAANGTSKSASVTSTVTNSTGSELPSTGGIGTTIFYTVGGLMMAAAIVLLVAKKKVAASK